MFGQSYRTDSQDIAILQRLNELAERYGLAPHDFSCNVIHEKELTPKDIVQYGGSDKRLQFTAWPNDGHMKVGLEDFSRERHQFDAFMTALNLYVVYDKYVLISEIFKAKDIFATLDQAIANAPPLKSHADKVKASANLSGRQ